MPGRAIREMVPSWLEVGHSVRAVLTWLRIIVVNGRRKLTPYGSGKIDPRGLIHEVCLRKCTRAGV